MKFGYDIARPRPSQVFNQRLLPTISRVLPYTPEAFINAEILQPQRQGLFGLLSVGFIATGGMSMIGLLAYHSSLCARRSVELGVLRAIGVSQQTLRSILGIEQCITIGFSTGMGVLIGSVTSLLYLPFLKVRDGSFPDLLLFLYNLLRSTHS
jgi:putative ABC transport system permease protein